MALNQLSADGIVERLLAECILSPFAPEPRGTRTKELIGILVPMPNPRARIVTSPHRRLNLFKVFGRFLWEVGGNDSLEVISYYDEQAVSFAKGDRIPSAYGKRLLNYGKSGLDQVGRLITTLKADPDSRRATTLILTPYDSPSTTREYPCIIGFQFLIRDKKLFCIEFIRSCSILSVFPTDIFIGTMFMEIVAAELGVDMGGMTFMIGSAHIYPNDLSVINNIMNQGIQEIPYEMGNLFTVHNPGLPALIGAETSIRKGSSNLGIDPKLMLKYKDEEWAQILHTLIVYRNLLNNEKGLGRLPSYLALNQTYKIMVRRHIPDKLFEGGTSVSIQIKKKDKKKFRSKSKLREVSKNAIRVSVDTTRKRKEGQPVEGDDKPSGWLSEVSDVPEEQ